MAVIDGGFSMAGAGRSNRPKWSEWVKTWVLFKKYSITGQSIRGEINYRSCRVWAGGVSLGEFTTEEEWATDKEIFEESLKGTISKYYGD